MKILSAKHLKKYYGSGENETRALASKLAIILADEPTGNLDSKTGLDVIALLKMTSKRFSQTIVMKMFEGGRAELCDERVFLNPGI